MVDKLRSQKSYRRASSIIVRAYLKLYDERPRHGGGGKGGNGLPDMTNMTAAEKKRVKAKVTFPLFRCLCCCCFAFLYALVCCACSFFCSSV